MQYDVDLNGEFSDIFLKLRNIILSCKGIREQKNAKQTAYYDNYSSVCFLRSNTERLTMSLAKGSRLQDTYPFLQGEGKVVRHLYFYNLFEIDEILIREIIKETMILNMEHYELKKLRCNRKV